MTRICLSMICRDEAHCIGRCLQSVIDLIDCYKIVDTGSQDDTINIISEVLKDKPGIIRRVKWEDDFAYHRNQALPAIGEFDLSQEDYVLFADADDEMVISIPFSKDQLVAECYGIANMDGELANFRPHLFKLRPGVKWTGVRHEDIEGATFDTFSLLRSDQIKFLVHHEGARSKNTNKVVDDAVALLRAREDLKPGILYNRYTCLIAQSFMDAGMFTHAIEYYSKYIDIANDDPYKESLWMGRFMLAICYEQTGQPRNEIVNMYMEAIEYNPDRIEPYFLLAKYLVAHNGLNSAKSIMERSLKVEPKIHALRSMAGWYEQRQEFYDEICEKVEAK